MGEIIDFTYYSFLPITILLSSHCLYIALWAENPTIYNMMILKVTLDLKSLFYFILLHWLGLPGHG